jgi:nucleosome binding factor SPN SPT16 subunit
LGQRSRFYDRDGLREEQEERQRKKKWNERFRDFVKQVEDTVSKYDPTSAFEFDIPYRDLMFQGTPNKSSVQILPTLNCLVALEDNPPFVLTLDDVEVANFERVQVTKGSHPILILS